MIENRKRGRLFFIRNTAPTSPGGIFRVLKEKKKSNSVNTEHAASLWRRRRDFRGQRCRSALRIETCIFAAKNTIPLYRFAYN